MSLRKRQILIAAAILLTCTTVFLLSPAGKRITHVVTYATRPLWDEGEAAKFDTVVAFYPPSVDLAHVRNDSGTVPVDSRLCTAHGWQPVSPETANSRRVVDVTLFSVELDMLELRIRELMHVVDVFVIAEAPFTFTGKPKPLVFAENRDRFNFAKSKIQYVELPGRKLAPGEDPFEIEGDNRRNVGVYLRTSEKLKLKVGDLLIMADVDEIPSREAVQLVRSCDGVPEALHLRMRNFMYSYDFQVDAEHWRAKIVRVTSTAAVLYTHRLESTTILADAGWHCSFCFPKISDFVFKMTGYSHADRVSNKGMLNPKRIQRIICEGSDIFDMLPEAYSFKELASKWGPLTRLESAVHVPSYLLDSLQTGDARFKYLLPGGCVRED
ncbi:hypothetical protein HDU77_002425 [Chytriomyces hyalinus]|nr:hypothetical protein HDU77_002425 [Chytriomyces hyalinus]